MGMAAIVIEGNVGKVDFDDKTFDDPKLEISVAVNTGKKGDDEITNWYRCTVWGKRAKALKDHIDVGTRLVIAGALVCREYEGKSGKGFSLDLRVDQLSFVGPKRDTDDATRGSNQKKSGSSRWED